VTTITVAESIIDKAIEIRCIGGVYGNQRPTEFLCLLLKLLQIQPEKEILIEYLRADEFKYVGLFLACLPTHYMPGT
jgi:pre-mRNA-splicing factor 38A